jgi:transposase-like protein
MVIGGEEPPLRRSFSPEYKLAIAVEYENSPNGEKGAILRREGLYSSHVIEWTRARDAGALEGVADSRRSEKRPKRSAEAAELELLRAWNAKLEAELKKDPDRVGHHGKSTGRHVSPHCQHRAHIVRESAQREVSASAVNWD